MRYRTVFLVLGVIMMACALYPQTKGGEQITGVWRGQIDNLPAVTLTITDEGGGLSGAILFYLIKRSSVMSEPTTSNPGIPEPLLNLKNNGSVLEFEVSHRRAHPPKTLSDPPVRFHLQLTGPDTAELVNESEKAGPSLVLTREH